MHPGWLRSSTDLFIRGPLGPCALGEPAFVAAEGDRRRGPGCAALRAESWLHDLVLTDRALFWERPSEGVKNAPDGAMRGLQLWRTMAATFS